jgi:UDP-N-acetylglucosamine 2-epimerase
VITVLSVIGTRPEGIKMAPVVQALGRRSEQIHSIVCSTGQHREMLEQTLALFAITPDYDLRLMQQNQGLADLTARLIVALDRLLANARPDCVLAQGDTTTVLATSLVSFYRGVPFGHVEAGLRTGDRRRPFPEEINRRIADVVADLYFAPTRRAHDALVAEGVNNRDIYVTGNTVIDALLEVADRPFDSSGGPLGALPPEKRVVLITAHRRESFGEQFRKLCLAIRDLSLLHRETTQFVYPVHLNPNVRRPVHEILGGLKNVTLLEPLDYASLVHVMKRSTLILTDSGGIQEEAPSLGVPVLVMRETTERPEGVDAGVVRLVGTARATIVQEAQRLLTDPVAHSAMAKAANPYGDGHAAERIVSAILERVHPRVPDTAAMKERTA